MTLIFAHDHKFIATPEGQVYSAGKYPYRIWQRYLEVFEQLVVVGRQSEVTNPSIEHLDLSSGTGVSFQFLPTLTDPLRFFRNRRMARELLIEAMSRASAVVARLPSENGLLAINCARELGLPCMVELVGCPSDAMRFHGSMLGRFYAPISRWRVATAVRDARLVVYVTEAFLQSRYPTKGYAAVCSNVEIGIVEAVQQRRLARIDSESMPFVIGTIAPLGIKYKGIEVALGALAAIADEYPNVHYEVLGGGDSSRYHATIRANGLKGRVTFRGMLPAGEPVNAWLDGVDIYIQPSLTEGLPRSLIEAMSRGCPALGSKAGGIPELLEAPFLHDPGDVEALAQGLRQLMNDDLLRRREAIRNMEVARAYSAESIQLRRTRILRRLRESSMQAQ